MSHVACDTPSGAAEPVDVAPTLKASAVERALSYYLPAPLLNHPAPPEFIDVGATLTHATEFMRCAVATAAELGENLSGSNRALAFTAMHMIEMAKVMVERSLDCVEAV